MLECRACVLRCIRAVAGDAHAAMKIPQRPLLLTPHLTQSPGRRRFATARIEEPPTEDPLSSLLPLENPTEDLFKGAKGGKIVINNEKALRKELDFLQDRFKLAEHVDYTLRNNNPDKALDMCRLASRNMECVVAWNHVVAWHMKNSRVNKAIDIFNEMKKRGQFPDGYTYTRLFKGFAGNPDYITKAVSIYYSMNSPASKVKPNITHTNIILRVCALAYDMDALWGVISQIPDTGPNAPDSITYTTILQAIRHSAMGDQEDPDKMAERRQDAVNEGRRIWLEIIAKWRVGSLTLDEGLVVAMADLLLTSRNINDLDDVLNLVHQTTKVERQVTLLSSPERQTGHVPNWESQNFKDKPISNGEDPDGFLPTPSAQAFKPVTPQGRDPDHPKRPVFLAYVQPGNSILSVLIRACDLMRAPKGANSYWDLLTTEYRVKPDIGNFHSMIRVLHFNRSARRVAQVISRIHEGAGVGTVVPLTYQLGMKVCSRDHKNPKIGEIATMLIDDMEKHLDYPDIETLELYLSVTSATNDGPQIVAALNRLEKSIEIVREKVASPSEVRHRRQWPYSADDRVTYRNHALRLLQSVIGKINTLIRDGMVPSDRQTFWQNKRSQYDGYLSIMISSLESSKHFRTGKTKERHVTGAAQDRHAQSLQHRSRERQPGVEQKYRMGRELAEGMEYNKGSQEERRLPRPQADWKFVKRGKNQREVKSRVGLISKHLVE